MTIESVFLFAGLFLSERMLFIFILCNSLSWISCCIIETVCCNKNDFSGLNESDVKRHRAVKNVAIYSLMSASRFLI